MNDLGKELDDFLGSEPVSEPVGNNPPAEPVEPAPFEPADPGSGEPPSSGEPGEPPTEPVEPVVEPGEPVEPVEPVAPVGTVPPGEPALDALSEREKLLEARIEELEGKLLQRGVEPTTVEPPPAVTPVEPEPPKPLNFLEGIDLDEVLDTPEKLNDLLISVHNKSIEEGSRIATERVLRSIPQLVTTYVARNAAMSGVVSDFYKANADLVNVKRTVAGVANEIAAEHPDWNVGQVFDEAAIRARKVLGMKAGVKPVPPPVIDPAPQNVNDPAFAGQGSRKVVQPKLDKLEKEVSDLIS